MKEVKIEDLTIKKINKMCKKHKGEYMICRGCPLFRFCDSEFINPPNYWDEEDLKKRIEE